MFLLRVSAVFLGVSICCTAFSQAFAASCPTEVFRPEAKPKGVILLTHGMNLRPSCLNEMALAFTKAGYEVRRPSFTGHCEDNKKYLEVKKEDWLRDADHFHKEALDRAKKLKAPLILVAYSFSALIYKVTAEENPFDKRILIAPAVASKYWYPWVIWILNQFPNFTYSSNVPEACAANRTSGARPILVLHEILNLWKDGKGMHDKAPTLVLAEPDDELVDYKGLQKLAASLDHWKLERVSNEGKKDPKSYHHLIVTPESVGDEEWKRMMGLALEFLKVR